MRRLQTLATSALRIGPTTNLAPLAMNRPAVGASTMLPTPMITLGSDLAKWRVTSRKVWAANSPRLVNSMQRAPPSAQAWITLTQVSTSG